MGSDNRPRQREYQEVDVSGQEWGSDFIADLLKAQGFDFVSFNPGASFRGIEESIVNYNDNVPQVVETTHEGLSVSIAHGYAKATGEPSVCILHDVVGTMHGAMSIFNAYADRVPVLVLSGGGPLRKSIRRPWIDWVHSALIQGNLVRDYVKWDDQPMAADGVADSILRAHKIADTAPKGPTYVTLDHDVQENPLDEPMEIPDLEKFEPPAPTAPNPDAVEEAAEILANAEKPVILVDQVGDTPEAVEALVEFAETAGAAVVDVRKRRYNFPNTHPLNLSGTEIYQEADVILGLNLYSLNYFVMDVDSEPHQLTDTTRDDVTFIDVGTDDLEISSLVTDYYAMRETDISMVADQTLAARALRDAVEERLDESDALREAAAERRASFEERHDEQRAAWQAQAEEAWDETPISIPRLASEIWDVVKDDLWVIVNGQLRNWPHRLWEIDEFDKYIGGDTGGAGVGYGVGGAIGGALAYSNTDRTPINFQADGDLMFYPGGLWTMSHYDIPLFNVVHNNKSLYNSTAHRMRLAEYRGRDASFESALIGTGIWDPVPDYAGLAESMGLSGYGPIEDPDDLRPALDEAWEEAKAGSPVLVDVPAQPR